MKYSRDKVVFRINWIKVVCIVCLLMILAACDRSTEDTEEYIGVIVSQSSMGYEYTVSKETDSFKWEVSYKDDVMTIEETEMNARVLDLFRMAVEDNRVATFQLGLMIVYLVVILSLIGFIAWRKPKTFRPYNILLSVIALGVISFLLYHSVLDFQRTLGDLGNIYAAIKEQK